MDISYSLKNIKDSLRNLDYDKNVQTYLIDLCNKIDRDLIRDDFPTLYNRLEIMNSAIQAMVNSLKNDTDVGDSDIDNLKLIKQWVEEILCDIKILL